MSPGATLSVIVPTLDAAATLPRTLAAIEEGRRRGLVAEIVVADGGSADGTRGIARAAGARVVDAPRGRGPQLAAGAAAARGGWLLFLHADTVPEAGWAASCARFIEHHSSPACGGGEGGGSRPWAPAMGTGGRLPPSSLPPHAGG